MLLTSRTGLSPPLRPRAVSCHPAKHDMVGTEQVQQPPPAVVHLALWPWLSRQLTVLLSTLLSAASLSCAGC